MIEIDHVDHLETSSMAHRELKGQIEGFPGVVIQIGHIQQRFAGGDVFLSSHNLRNSYSSCVTSD